ncbi:hypothetical protein EVAR_85312_1 [Eumeta japonica]|uniref:Secreted protein n=1 Tax=Eumeta variegata TaxID=151549 RepID=A0A4C1V8F8_EUMVA|nr:hypothetical protein EVAR_85312_1 [Eumeta japonica]
MFMAIGYCLLVITWITDQCSRVQRTKLCRCEVSLESVAMAENRNTRGRKKDRGVLSLCIASFTGNSERKRFVRCTVGESSLRVGFGHTYEVRMGSNWITIIERRPSPMRVMTPPLSPARLSVVHTQRTQHYIQILTTGTK